MEAYLCKEGMVRLCTARYKTAKPSNFHRYVHVRTSIEILSRGNSPAVAIAVAAQVRRQDTSAKLHLSNLTFPRVFSHLTNYSLNKLNQKDFEYSK